MNHGKLRGGYSTMLGGGRLRLADDHILAVYSYPIKESYRRFYLREIQSITVTRCPRYVLTNRSLIAGLVLSILLVPPQTQGYAGLLLLGLILAWLVLSYRAGCVCRIHTAVSSETLPVRRIWAANALVDQVEPLIREAQRDVAIRDTMAPVTPQVMMPESTTPFFTAIAPEVQPAVTWATVGFVVSLIVAAGLAGLRHYAAESVPFWTLYATILIPVALAIWMFMEHRHGAGKGPRWLAIAHLTFLGVAGYVQIIVTNYSTGRSGNFTFQTIYGRPNPIFWDIYGSGCVVLAIAGMIVLLSAPRTEPT